MLENINSPKDLKDLNYNEKRQLAKEIRELIINTVSKTGGHLASNLGAVELTIALHSIFNTPKDKIIWDVGHQTYVHKILTGRKDKFNTLRQYKGISGFPKTKESEYDTFDTGHSSTSISIATGMARARDLKGNDEYIISVIGDGALTGGMAMEALNDSGDTIKKNFIVILNDNEMSISKNVGGMSSFLTNVRTRKFYRNSNNRIREFFKKIPILGNFIIKLVVSTKYGLMKISMPNMIFEDLGFRYLGPIDGNNIEEVERILKEAKKIDDAPVLIHMVTKKGKGYLPAEENPDKFHSTGAFDIDNPNQVLKKDYSYVFGKQLLRIARKKKNVVAVTAAMADGTGLSEFAKKYPDRFFDVGIAEQNAITMSAGMAKCGMKPFVSIYSSFYQRCYDQVIDDVCLQNLPVVMCIDRAGIVGQDGETHQGILDLAFFNIVPKLVVMAPKDFFELEQMLDFAARYDGPIAIRYPRGSEDKNVEFNKHSKIDLGKAEILREDKESKITIIAIGKMVARAIEVANELEVNGIKSDVINARFLKLTKNKNVLDSINKTKRVVTIEDGIVKGGFGSNIKEMILDKNISDVRIRSFGYPDKFIEHGKPEELEKKYKLDVSSIVWRILQDDKDK